MASSSVNFCRNAHRAPLLDNPISDRFFQAVLTMNSVIATLKVLGLDRGPAVLTMNSVIATLKVLGLDRGPVVLTMNSVTATLKVLGLDRGPTLPCKCCRSLSCGAIVGCCSRLGKRMKPLPTGSTASPTQTVRISHPDVASPFAMLLVCMKGHTRAWSDSHDSSP
jgi:hypothetical protein